MCKSRLQIRQVQSVWTMRATKKTGTPSKGLSTNNMALSGVPALYFQGFHLYGELLTGYQGSPRSVSCPRLG